MKRLTLGLGLTLLVSALLVWGWGRPALVPGLVFGFLATAIQLASWALVAPVLGAPFARLASRWAAGMALRLLGVVMVAVAVVAARETFPPVPTALGFLGVMIPLLLTEMRSIR